MIEIQGVTERDPAKAASQLLLRVGRRLSLRRGIQALCLFLTLSAVGIAYWRTQLPPPPWEFGGRVVDSETRLPISDVRVEADGKLAAYTDRDGNYSIFLPQPKPKHLRLIFAKEGYKGEEPVNVNPDHAFDTDMIRLKLSAH